MRKKNLHLNSTLMEMLVHYYYVIIYKAVIFIIYNCNNFSTPVFVFGNENCLLIIFIFISLPHFLPLLISLALVSL